MKRCDPALEAFRDELRTELLPLAIRSLQRIAAKGEKGGTAAKRAAKRLIRLKGQGHVTAAPSALAVERVWPPLFD